jgi:hypothetical protein
MLLIALAALASATPDAAPNATPASTPPAATAPAAATTAAAAPPKAKEEMICKSEDVTGSRFAKKVCYSKAEYEAHKQQQQQELRQNQTGGLYRR